MVVVVEGQVVIVLVLDSLFPLGQHIALRLVLVVQVLLLALESLATIQFLTRSHLLGAVAVAALIQVGL
jgi:hypothetical protein